MITVCNIALFPGSIWPYLTAYCNNNNFESSQPSRNKSFGIELLERIVQLTNDSIGTVRESAFRSLGVVIAYKSLLNQNHTLPPLYWSDPDSKIYPSIETMVLCAISRGLTDSKYLVTSYFINELYLTR
jgi:hypothetical protein